MRLQYLNSARAKQFPRPTQRSQSTVQLTKDQEPEPPSVVVVAIVSRRWATERTRYIIDHGNNEWLLIREGAEQPLARFKKKQLAISRGREIARRRGGQLIVKGKDHAIREEWTYDRDPNKRFWDD